MKILLSRIIKTSLDRIGRNPFHTIAAIVVMFLVLFAASFFSLVLLGSSVVLTYFESKPQVTAFLTDDVSTTEIENIKNELLKTNGVSDIKYISKDEALKIYKEQHKDEPLLTEFVTAEILPSSIEVSSSDLNKLPAIAELLKNERGVDEVVFAKDIIDTLNQWIITLRNIGVVSGLFLVIVAILTILIVISLNISLHKDEIEIMALVGASPSYIRTPFILEGAIYGIIAALLALIATVLTLGYLSPFLKEIFVGIPLFPLPLSLYFYLTLAEVALGIILGAIGATIATRKYLQV